MDQWRTPISWTACTSTNDPADPIPEPPPREPEIGPEEAEYIFYKIMKSRKDQHFRTLRPPSKDSRATTGNFPKHCIVDIDRDCSDYTWDFPNLSDHNFERMLDLGVKPLLPGSESYSLCSPNQERWVMGHYDRRHQWNAASLQDMFELSHQINGDGTVSLG